MYIYTIQAMPGQKAKFEGDPSIKYQVKRVDTSLKVGKKGRSEVIRTNLDYEDAMTVINNFNEKEKKSNDIKDEAARQKEKL